MTNSTASLPASTAHSFIASGHAAQTNLTNNSALYALVNSSSHLLLNTSYNYKYHEDSTQNATMLHHQQQHFFELGPQRDPLEIVIPVTIIYVLIFVSGVIGNISTCIVIKKNRSMHTATNYYLFSLAISDFLLLLSGVPQEMYFIWSKYPYVFGEYFCIGRGVLAETSANATVLTITAFTVERYMAICHPFLGQAMSKLSRAIRIIILIWLVSVLTAIPQAAQFGMMVLNGVEKCVVVRNIIQHSFQLSTFIFFFAPMSIILVLYLLIGLRLYRSNLMGGGAVEAVNGRNSGSGSGGGGDGSVGGISGSGHLAFGNSSFIRASTARKGSSRISMKGTQSDAMLCRYVGGNHLSAVRGRMNQYGTRRVIKMLVAVVICFFLCWAPFHAQRLFAIYGVNIMGSSSESSAGNGQHVMIFTVMTYVSGVLYYLSTCINPLLYNLMSNKFRQAFKSILFRKKSNGFINYRRSQQSQNLRRTLTSSTQRESSDSESKSKHSMLQVIDILRS
ncbi:pyrokinin-1 receptor [Eurosta solidaginis]|uniref:pyrokinin-1 receptor n=1 Tax=Eurosta solidaginis TaxID=178769 RepID=UPI003530D890